MSNNYAKQMAATILYPCKAILGIAPYSWLIPALFLYWGVGEFAAQVLGLPPSWSVIVGSFKYNVGLLSLTVFLCVSFFLPPRLVMGLLVVTLPLTFFPQEVDVLVEMSFLAWLFNRLWFAFLFLAVGSIIATFISRKYTHVHLSRAKWVELFAVLLFVFVYAPSALNFLNLTVMLQPQIFDFRLHALDFWFGVQPSVVLSTFARNNDWYLFIIESVYSALPLVVVLITMRQLIEGRGRRWDAIGVWFVLSVLALFTYHIIPITGPKYAYASLFPEYMHTVGHEFGAAAGIVSYRNGFPSMHFGWSFAFWIIALSMRSLWVKWLSAFNLVLMILATLSLGEHYLIDLVVAMPFVITVMALLLKRGAWGWGSIRTHAFWGGALLYAIWTWVVLAHYQFLYDFPLVKGGLAIVSVIFSLYSAFGLAFDSCCAPDEPVPSKKSKSVVKKNAGFSVAWATLLFFLSGFAALTYEVLFSKQLANTFGSSSLASYTVLATYMGGMAIGAWLGGFIALKTAKWVRWYLICELFIALYCVLTPLIFDLLPSLYVGLVSEIGGNTTFYRMLLGGISLLIPTVLMGATLPLMVAFLKDRGIAFGSAVSSLYGANTIGAAFGSVVGGYLLIPSLGLTKTTLVAALVNLLVIYIALKWFIPQSSKLESSNSESLEKLSSEIREYSFLRVAVPLVGLFVAGLSCLALEVFYMHLLAVVIGNSVYAFSIMLAVFLVGLGIGGYCVGRVPQLVGNPQVVSICALIGIALFISLGSRQWEVAANYLAAFAYHPVEYGFYAREFIRAIICCSIILPLAICIGMFYPSSMSLVSMMIGIRGIGFGASINTVGNIVGVVVAGLILLPLIGAYEGAFWIALICLLVAVFYIVYYRIFKLYIALSFLVSIFALYISPKQLDVNSITTGANVYFYPNYWGQVVEYAESADGGLTAVHKVTDADGRTHTYLTTNGKFQGNDSSEMHAQIGFALVPLESVGDRNAALVIGYGTGVSANALHHMGFANLDIVDLSNDVFILADKYFSHVNGGVRKKPGVESFVMDGRNYLLLHDRLYDLITVELSSIWFAGAASIYNQEFYRLAKRRLTSNGVLQQWIQLHHISPESILSILASIKSEFEFVELHHFGGQGMLVATNSIVAHQLNAKPFSEYAAKNLYSNLLGGMSDEEPELILDNDGVARFLRSAASDFSMLVSNDDNNYLEYNTPKGNVLDSAESYNRNLSLLREYQ